MGGSEHLVDVDPGSEGLALVSLDKERDDSADEDGVGLDALAQPQRDDLAIRTRAAKERQLLIYNQEQQRQCAELFLQLPHPNMYSLSLVYLYTV